MPHDRSPPGVNAKGPVPEPGPSGNENRRQSERSSTPRKWQRLLGAFLAGRTLNRFEAAREFRDWCLNTSVSQLERRGLKILRRMETVPGTFGDVHCCRYWLAPESDELARKLVSSKEDA